MECMKRRICSAMLHVESQYSVLYKIWDVAAAEVLQMTGEW